MKHDPIVFVAEDLSINAVREDGGEIAIVKGVSFEVPRGKVVALIGESGSGKTTIALSALGYCRPGMRFVRGQAKLLGKNLTDLTVPQLRQIRGRKVAYLAQSAAAAFNPSLRINEQVVEAALQAGDLTRAEADARALQLYRALELPDPEGIGRRYPHQLSGGQLQRLMAAAALCSQPDLLVLDEPTTALDVTTQIEVLKSFKRVIRDNGAAAIYVTHDLAVVAQIADYVVVLYRGEIREMGPVEQIISEPRHAYTRRLMAARQAGSPIAEARNPKESRPALEVKHVSAKYGQSPVLSAVDLTIRRGEAVGIIGESGSGKSTLARVIAGLLPPSEGGIFLDGEAIEPTYRKRSTEQLRRIQLVYQSADTALNPRRTVGQILERTLELYFKTRGVHKRKRVSELLALVDLDTSFAARFPEELSGGQKQRINLARALAAEPDVILCDEVTSALDTIVGANILELLKRLRLRAQLSFAFISHDLSTIASFADETVVLYGGKVVERGPTEQVLTPPYHPYTRLLIESVPEMRVGWLEGAIERQASKKDEASISQAGCPFFGRCPLAIDGVCDTYTPPRVYVRGAPNHYIDCHRDIADLEHPRWSVPTNRFP